VKKKGNGGGNESRGRAAVDQPGCGKNALEQRGKGENVSKGGGKKERINCALLWLVLGGLGVSRPPLVNKSQGGKKEREGKHKPQGGSAAFWRWAKIHVFEEK